MGKRRSSNFRRGGTSNLKRLPTEFDCPFCSRQRSCTVNLKKRIGVGTVTCRFCKEEFHTTIHTLSEAVDVYADWIDACEKINK